ncbi:MAG: diguanylate cyclase [Acidobacteriaceae bacterium]
MKVLIAAQEEARGRQIEQLLQSEGFATVAVGDGKAALRALEGEAAPRVAIFDWLLPQMDGTEVCRRLRAASDERYIYCILLVQSGAAETVAHLLESGADDVLALPMALPLIKDELLARLRGARRILDLQEQLLAARDALRFESTHDGATGVLNRAGLRENLHREYERATRFGTTCGAVLVDLDHFRLINESFGYQAGDIVLREVASRIRNTVRAYDVVGRYGADEFLVLSPETSGPALMAEAERILAAMSSTPVAFDGQEIIVTASIGVATNEERTEAEMVQSSETAMKQAKLTGRNSVEFARNFTVDMGFAPQLVERTFRPN